MQKTTYQRPEIRDENNHIIQTGTYGKNTALSNDTNDGVVDYINNNLEWLHDRTNNTSIKTFSNLVDLGISGNTTVNALALAIASQPESFETYLSQGTLANGITDLPIGYCMVHIVYIRGNRVVIEVLGGDRVYRAVSNMDGLRNLQPSDFRRYNGVAI